MPACCAMPRQRSRSRWTRAAGRRTPRRARGAARRTAPRARRLHPCGAPGNTAVPDPARHLPGRGDDPLRGDTLRAIRLRNRGRARVEVRRRPRAGDRQGRWRARRSGPRFPVPGASSSRRASSRFRKPRSKPLSTANPRSFPGETGRHNDPMSVVARHHGPGAPPLPGPPPLTRPSAARATAEAVAPGGLGHGFPFLIQVTQ